MKLFVFSKHALARLLERSISKSLVIEAISSPDKVVRKTDFTLSLKQIAGATLVIAYRETDNSFFIITAYFSTKARYQKR
jgi:hypothetical protein